MNIPKMQEKRKQRQTEALGTLDCRELGNFENVVQKGRTLLKGPLGILRATRKLACQTWSVHNVAATVQFD